jgi:hypothetical protein
MVQAWNHQPDIDAWKRLLDESRRPTQPVLFAAATDPMTICPAYRGVIRAHHRCAANDLPPWERFEVYPADDPGVATCQQCNWPLQHERGRTNS